MRSMETTASITEALINAGEFAHGGDPESVAAEWQTAGFTADETGLWLDARCFTAEGALQLSDANVTAQQAAERTDAGLGGYEDTIGYKVANGDMTAHAAAAIFAREVIG